MEKGLRYLSHMFLAMDQHLEYKNVIVVIFHIYIGKLNQIYTKKRCLLLKIPIFVGKKIKEKNQLKLVLFNKLVFLQLLAKYLCNLSSFDKVGLHHNKHNLIILLFFALLLLLFEFS